MSLVTTADANCISPGGRGGQICSISMSVDSSRCLFHKIHAIQWPTWNSNKQLLQGCTPLLQGVLHKAPSVGKNKIKRKQADLATSTGQKHGVREALVRGSIYLSINLSINQSIYLFECLHQHMNFSGSV